MLLLVLPLCMHWSGKNFTRICFLRMQSCSGTRVIGACTHWATTYTQPRRNVWGARRWPRSAWSGLLALQASTTGGYNPAFRLWLVPFALALIFRLTLPSKLQTSFNTLYTSKWVRSEEWDALLSPTGFNRSISLIRVKCGTQPTDA